MGNIDAVKKKLRGSKNQLKSSHDVPGDDLLLGKKEFHI